MDIRPFVPDDTADCLTNFDSNSDFLTASGRVSFAAFLQQPPSPFLVMEHERDLVGCGGFTVSGHPPEAHLLWGMIRRDCQRQGLGRFLLMFRLREIGKLGTVESVIADVPPMAVPFFDKEGFRTACPLETGRVRMVKRLTVCA